jgi:tRNA pseudouridine38-40 synthase
MTVRGVPSPPPGFCRVRMTVAYDGRPFRGWAHNIGVTSVERTLEEALVQVLRHPVTMAVAGRTDAGVHARGQVVSFDADIERLIVTRLADSLNGLVAPFIAVRGVEVAADDFDARFSCVGRTYRYRVLNSRVPDPLVGHLAWHVRHPLDEVAMQAGCAGLLGTHDFSAFCRRNKSKPDQVLVRNLRRAEWHREGDVLRFEIEASAFCHQMVRSIVGTLVDVGKGRRGVDDVEGILVSRDRNVAPSPAPPHGLILQHAAYA